jgi:hypothetical protein
VVSALLEPLGEGVAVHVQVEEPHLRGSRGQHIAVAAQQGGAGHDPTGDLVLDQPVRDRREPRAPVVVVERRTGRHLGDVGLRVEAVSVRERRVEGCGQRAPHRGLAGS